MRDLNIESSYRVNNRQRAEKQRTEKWRNGEKEMGKCVMEMVTSENGICVWRSEMSDGDGIMRWYRVWERWENELAVMW
jgi:hypothetical protein